jgi:hypothetical protein
MLTILKRKVKKKISEKIIFQTDIYSLNLDKRNSEIYGFSNQMSHKVYDLDFSSLCILFQTDKGPFVHSVMPSFLEKKMKRCIIQTHNYAKYYEKLFRNKRKKIKNLCEIGVMSGASTAAFYFYFPKTNLYALDINFQRFNLKSSRIKKFKVDQSSPVSLQNFKKKINGKKLDIIIDDGSHIDNHILLTFKQLIVTLNSNGYYIIEDLSYENTPQTLRFLKLKKNLRQYKISDIKIFESEEGSDLIKKDRTKMNYIAFLRK